MKSRFAVSARRHTGQKGAVTISYLWPGTGTPSPTPPPTPQNSVCATVVASAAADTSAVITHQLGLTNAQITQGFPFMTLLAQDGNAITSPWWESSQAPNYTVIQKGTTAAGGQVKVRIMRPWEPEK
jgi:hypothetical protein